MSASANYVSETQTIRELAGDKRCRWQFTVHALDRMAQRGLYQSDIENALTKGHVVLVETHQRDITWRVRGKDLDGKTIEVVVAVRTEPSGVKVITVFFKS